MIGGTGSAGESIIAVNFLSFKKNSKSFCIIQGSKICFTILWNQVISVAGIIAEHFKFQFLCCVKRAQQLNVGKRWFIFTRSFKCIE